ncbi:chromosomal replication initiator protein DnaA [Azorhizobium oxalatiphilum]|uniref:Chromosomal replication initiator protein DnaA n=1 Tax=Azorhizobium oxalatiphilum TaxID=980631 RepID=A0A917F311_9HYPH|nr:chromosomal replication initiator DnaA [Azorhizobium oxalatiphilum]GGF45806.1 chromosomal replication initiator protein DnaA [Azorhizobium oxalatiphilum]
MTTRDTKVRQLPLDLPAAAAMQREDFLGAPGNAAALKLIDSFPDWTARVVCLVGPAGTGKSHLARVFAAHSGARTVFARDLVRAGVPEALADGALVVEDLVPGEFDEAALFHLLNLARETQAYVLMTARSMPSAWKLNTADLASRLRALPTFEILEADDPLLAAVLVKLFADRQISVDDTTVQFLLRRMERTVEGAQTVVEAIDRAALAAHRPVTRTLAAQVLRELMPDEDDGENGDEEDEG